MYEKPHFISHTNKREKKGEWQVSQCFHFCVYDDHHEMVGKSIKLCHKIINHPNFSILNPKEYVFSLGNIQNVKSSYMTTMERYNLKKIKSNKLNLIFQNLRNVQAI